MSKTSRVAMLEYNIENDAFILQINGGEIELSGNIMTADGWELMQRRNATKDDVKNILEIVKVNGGVA